MNNCFGYFYSNTCLVNLKFVDKLNHLDYEDLSVEEVVDFYNAVGWYY